ncbi:hypothetical protein [Legionella rowbothamii]|uniref:hypothetical protein n=1 Tax=Legionella rowbothamii TaxID=96229 RepID=UPI001054B2DD|nr:hypothetical protein [Legionella rowbothamii]
MDTKLDTVNEKASTTQAVVIGCSHNNSECDHKIHPSRDIFFTIDILPKLEPDLCMDITKHSVPDYLKNKFQLTILEFLPSDVYNLNKPSRALFKIDGEMGWQHIKELTHDDGFIMVVGNITSFCYRSSLANLKFLELAHSEDLKASVILIPKNQNLTASEVKEKILQLSPELRDSIQIATTQGFIPSQSNEFCKSNYVPSEVNAELIDHLNQYRCMLLFVPDFHLHEELLKEIDAADALIDVLLGNAVESSLDIHQSALNRERLGGIIKAALDDKPLSALIDKTGNADPFNDFKVKYTDIKQQCSAEEDVNQAFYSGM